MPVLPDLEVSAKRHHPPEPQDKQKQPRARLSWKTYYSLFCCAFRAPMVPCRDCRRDRTPRVPIAGPECRWHDTSRAAGIGQTVTLYRPESEGTPGARARLGCAQGRATWTGLLQFWRRSRRGQFPLPCQAACSPARVPVAAIVHCRCPGGACRTGHMVAQGQGDPRSARSRWTGCQPAPYLAVERKGSMIQALFQSQCPGNPT